MLELGSEYFPLTLTIDPIDAAKPKRYTNPPLGRRLEPNALITDEFNAIRGAQLTQVCQPILLGKVPQCGRRSSICRGKFMKQVWRMIKPGHIRRVADYVNGFGANRGMKTVMQLHGCGYGDDGPLLVPARGERARDLPMKEAMCLSGGHWRCQRMRRYASLGAGRDYPRDWL